MFDIGVALGGNAPELLRIAGVMPQATRSDMLFELALIPFTYCRITSGVTTT
jgi:hypothetical protein